MKTSIQELAVFSGKPAFASPLYVGRPNIGNQDKILARMKDILDRRWLTNDGPYVQELEKKIAAMTGAKHCIAICNATIALEIAIRAADLKGEVIVPSFTFIATAHSLQWQEITPVFCDIDPVTHNIDPEAIEKMITPKTTGIIGVHLWGRTCDVDALERIAKKHNLKLLFDAAHAFGCTYKGKMVGTFGNAEVLSFHATKFLNAFEGGAILTNDDDFAKKVTLMKNFGFSGYDNVIYVGTNGKMSEASAAMGISSLEAMDEFIACNRRNHELYTHHLEGIPGIKLLPYDSSEKSNYQYVILEIDSSLTGIHRNDIVQVLHAENVLARRYFYPGCHRMEPYRSFFPHAGLLLPQTERLTERVMALPTGTAVGPEEIAGISELVRFITKHGPAVTDKISKLMARKDIPG